jgi:hypothetical protein
MRNDETRREVKNLTRRETRGSGNTREERTLHIRKEIEVTTYDKIFECQACGKESTTPRRRERTISEDVTATTPWQYR